MNAGARGLRSILFTPGEPENKLDPATTEAEATNLKDSSSAGYVNMSAEIFVATPFDPIFVLLPLVDRPASESRTKTAEGLFQPFDDLVDENLHDDGHLRHVLTDPTFRPTLLRAMDQICDSVDGGDEQLYRLSMHKLCEYIFRMAKRVVENGLPPSLEDRFVTRYLEAPILSVKREISTLSTVDTKDLVPDRLTPDTSDSQSSIGSNTNSVAVSEASSATSFEVEELAPPSDLRYLQRLRTAMSFISTSYLDPRLAARLAALSHDNRALADFAPLDEHLQRLAKLRVEALATRPLSDFSKKRNLDDDEADEERAEKKRKQNEEDKKRKSQESRGVRDLKKVDVSGMKKMSDFFAKRAPTESQKR